MRFPGILLDASTSAIAFCRLLLRLVTLSLCDEILPSAAVTRFVSAVTADASAFAFTLPVSVLTELFSAVMLSPCDVILPSALVTRLVSALTADAFASAVFCASAASVTSVITTSSM